MVALLLLWKGMYEGSQLGYCCEVYSRTLSSGTKLDGGGIFQQTGELGEGWGGFLTLEGQGKGLCARLLPRGTRAKICVGKAGQIGARL